MYKILRRGSGRVFVLCIVVLSLLLCLYYVSQVQAPSSGHPAILNEELRYDRSLTSVTPDYSESPDAQVSLATCPIIVPRNADIDAQQEFSKFDFQVGFRISVARKAVVSEAISMVFSLLSFSSITYVLLVPKYSFSSLASCTLTSRFLYTVLLVSRFYFQKSDEKLLRQICGIVNCVFYTYILAYGKNLTILLKYLKFK